MHDGTMYVMFDGTLHNILVQSKIPAIVLSVLLLRLWFRFLVVVLQQFINENDYVSRLTIFIQKFIIILCKF